MNKAQQLILITVASVLTVMLLFPPFYSMPGQVKLNKGYRFIFSPIKMAYWDKEAEKQAAISFERDIIYDKGWASSLDTYKMDFSFMRDPRWAGLDQATKNGMLASYFQDTVESDPRWNPLSEQDKGGMRRSFYEDAAKYEQEVRRVRELYFAEKKKEYPKKIESAAPSVDTLQLLMQVIVVTLIGGLLWLAFKDQRRSISVFSPIATIAVSKFSSSDSASSGHDSGATAFAGTSDKSAEEIISRKFWQAILGEKNKDYYQSKFEQFGLASGKYQISWNWPAFLLGGTWALYRKIYGWFFVWWIVSAFIIGFNKAIGRADDPWLDVGFFIQVFVNIIFALFANSLYRNNLQKKIEKAYATISDEYKLIQHLGHVGGVNAWVIWFAVSASVIGFLLAIMIPVFMGK